MDRNDYEYFRNEIENNSYVTFFNLDQARQLNNRLLADGLKIGYIELSQTQVFYKDAEGKAELIAKYKEILDQQEKKVMQTKEDLNKLSK